eukprot:Pgem_evm1s7220
MYLLKNQFYHGKEYNECGTPPQVVFQELPKAHYNAQRRISSDSTTSSSSSSSLNSINNNKEKRKM